MIDSEQRALDEIKKVVFESGLALRTSEVKDRESHFSAVKERLAVLTKSDADLERWSSDLNNKMEQVKGHGKTTFPKRDDPYFKLLAQTVPYIIELRKEKEQLEAWLATQVN